MEVRQAEVTDREAVIRLWHAAGLTRPWNDPVRDFDRADGGATSTVLVGVENGRILATAMVGWDGHRGWTYYLAVEPDQAGTGRGRAMMEAAEAWLAGAGAEECRLMVRRSNTEALGFYEAMGYETSDVIVMGRRLDGRPARPTDETSDDRSRPK